MVAAVAAVPAKTPDESTAGDSVQRSQGPQNGERPCDSRDVLYPSAPREDGGGVAAIEATASSGFSHMEMMATTSPDLSIDLEALRSSLEMTIETLRDDCGYSDEEIAADPDVTEIQQLMHNIVEGSPSETWKISAYVPPTNKTRKQTLKEWYKTKYARRHGLLGAHFHNMQDGKSQKQQRQAKKEFIKQKKSLVKRSRRMQKRVDSADKQEVAQVLTSDGFGESYPSSEKPVR